MYYTELDPWTRKPVFVEKDPGRKQKQKDIVTQKSDFSQKKNYGSFGKNRHSQQKRQYP
jgi:hypothetical protein